MRLMFAAIEDLNVLPLEARLAKQVLNLAASYGKRDADGIEIGLRLAQEDLAQLLGASRQRVNRELKAMERRGVLSARYGRLRLRDEVLLRAIALGGRK
jgi:CRP-like cAMP-binding protein